MTLVVPPADAVSAVTATATATASTTATIALTPSCPQCGCDLRVLAQPVDETQAALLVAQKHISDLEAQVRLLNQKASAAVDRWADYEDELAKLRTQLSSSSSYSSSSNPPPTALPATPPSAPYSSYYSSFMGGSSPSPVRSSFLTSSAATRITALLSPRKPVKPLPHPPAASRAWPASPGGASSSNTTTSSSGLGGPWYHYNPSGHSNSASTNTNTSTSSGAPLSPAVPLSPAPSTDDLLEALTREQALRVEAEGRLSETSREVEELSVSLFEQANEMVATERRARAVLEKRVETLEKRDADKKRRLDRLEGAMDRIDRVRQLLGQTEQQQCRHHHEQERREQEKENSVGLKNIESAAGTASRPPSPPRAHATVVGGGGYEGAREGSA